MEETVLREVAVGLFEGVALCVGIVCILVAVVFAVDLVAELREVRRVKRIMDRRD